jgi:hypothetical protein
VTSNCALGPLRARSPDLGTKLRNCFSTEIVLGKCLLVINCGVLIREDLPSASSEPGGVADMFPYRSLTASAVLRPLAEWITSE